MRAGKNPQHSTSPDSRRQRRDFTSLWTTCPARSFTRTTSSTSSSATIDFRDMYAAPAELLAAGTPVLRTSCAIWPTNGYYGGGRRRERSSPSASASLRNPSDRTFEDRTPDSCLPGFRRRVKTGGVVTVMTDITGSEGRSRSALADNEGRDPRRPRQHAGRACLYRTTLSTSSCAMARFREMYPAASASCSLPDGPIRTSSAFSPQTATTARATSTRWSQSGSTVCAILQTKSFEDRRTRRPRLSGSVAAGWQAGGVVTGDRRRQQRRSRAERELLEAKQRTEEANQLATGEEPDARSSLVQAVEVSRRRSCTSPSSAASRTSTIASQAQEAHGVLSPTSPPSPRPRTTSESEDLTDVSQPLPDRDVGDRPRVRRDHRQVHRRRHAALLRRSRDAGASRRTPRPAS